MLCATLCIMDGNIHSDEDVYFTINRRVYFSVSVSISVSRGDIRARELGMGD